MVRAVARLITIISSLTGSQNIMNMSLNRMNTRPASRRECRGALTIAGSWSGLLRTVAMTRSAQNGRSYRFQAMIQTCSLPPVPSWASADTVHESGLR